MNKYLLGIDGMRCGACVATINNLMRKNFKIKKIVTSRFLGETEIISEQDISMEDFHRVLDPTGYQLISYSKSLATKKGLFWY